MRLFWNSIGVWVFLWDAGYNTRFYDKKNTFCYHNLQKFITQSASLYILQQINVLHVLETFPFYVCFAAACVVHKLNINRQISSVQPEFSSSKKHV